jgi:hypothetical protein
MKMTMMVLVKMRSCPFHTPRNLHIFSLLILFLLFLFLRSHLSHFTSLRALMETLLFTLLELVMWRLPMALNDDEEFHTNSSSYDYFRSPSSAKKRQPFDISSSDDFEVDVNELFDLESLEV